MPNASRRLCDFPGCASGIPDANQLPTPYLTSAELRTREEVSEDLRLHIETAHMLTIRQAEAQAKALEMEARKIEMEARKYEAETARILANREPQLIADESRQTPSAQPAPSSRPFTDKRDSIPRPKIEQHISESEWGFFSAQWTRYVQGTGMSSTQEVQHLWAACDEQLQRALGEA